MYIHRHIQVDCDCVSATDEDHNDHVGEFVHFNQFVLLVFWQTDLGMVQSIGLKEL